MMNLVMVKLTKVGYDFNDVVQSATTWNNVNVLTTTQEFIKDLTSLLDYKTALNDGVLGKILLKIGNITFKTVLNTYSSVNDEENLVSLNSNSSGTPDAIKIRVNKTTYPTTTEFEAYLQANDVTFQFELDVYTNETYIETGASIAQKGSQYEVIDTIIAPNEHVITFATTTEAKTDQNKIEGDENSAQIDNVETKQGDLVTLTTTDKTSIVNAINELKALIDSFHP